jgi:acyl carrier protein
VKTPSQALVYSLLASHLQIDAEWILDADRFVELGLDPLDLVLVVLRIEDLCGEEGDFPLAELAHATTVGDFVALVDRWMEGDTMMQQVRAAGSRRGSAA